MKKKAWFFGVLMMAALAGACSDDKDGGDDQGSEDKGGGAGEDELCGGFSAVQCADDLFCDYPDDRCGATDGAGTCQPLPTVCTPVIDEVCGCDGEPYNSPCDAHKAGTDVSEFATCKE